MSTTYNAFFYNVLSLKRNNKQLCFSLNYLFIVNKSFSPVSSTILSRFTPLYRLNISNHLSDIERDLITVRQEAVVLVYHFLASLIHNRPHGSGLPRVRQLKISA